MKLRCLLLLDHCCCSQVTAASAAVTHVALADGQAGRAGQQLLKGSLAPAQQAFAEKLQSSRRLAVTLERKQVFASQLIAAI